MTMCGRVDDRPAVAGDDRPPFETRRLVATPLTRDHASELAPLLAAPEIHRFLNGGPETESQLRDRFARLETGWSPDGTQRWWRWLVRTRDGRAIGFAEATIETDRFYVAYVLGLGHRRRGYAREMTAAVIDLVFARFPVTHCLIEMDTRNTPSVALAESLGARRVDTVALDDGTREHVYRIERTT